jgi:predicted RNA binding protein YcfA (HicA-like mRNA interferase family)
MTTRAKREAAIRNNPVNVRFSDLDAFIMDNKGFTRTQPRGGSSHYTYTHPDLPDILTVPFRKPVVKRPYVVRALAAVDTVRASEIARKEKQQ